MDYKNKYFKYKNKYVNLKNQYGTGINTIPIEGPVSFTYYELQDGKKIMLFGDMHEQYKSIKNSIFFLQFIDYLIYKNIKHNNCLDIFIEDVFSKDRKTLKQKGGINDSYKINEVVEVKHKLEDKWMDGPVTNINPIKVKPFFYQDSYNWNYITKLEINKQLIDNFRSFLFDTTCIPKMKTSTKNFFDNDISINKCKGIRIHTWDLGQLYFKDKDMKSIIWFNRILNKLTINLENNYDCTCLYIYLIGAYDYNKEYYNKGSILFDRYVNNILLKKEIESSGQILMDKKNTEDVAKKINKQLNNIDTNYFTKEEFINFIISIIDNSNNNLTTHGCISNIKYKMFRPSKDISDLRLFITETYSIARMFRKFTENRIINCNNDNSLKNILYFAGNHHVKIVKYFLKTFFDKKITYVQEHQILCNNKKTSHYINLNKNTKYFGYNIDWSNIEKKNWSDEINKLTLKGDHFKILDKLYNTNYDNYDLWLAYKKNISTAILKKQINQSDLHSIMSQLNDKNVYIGNKIS